MVIQSLGKLGLGLCCLTPLHKAISSCPLRQNSSRIAAPFSEHHYPSLWEVMRFMVMVTMFFHPPPQHLLDSKELQSLPNCINIYLKAKQLFISLLPHYAALGMLHSHCYIPTLQFLVSFWHTVLRVSFLVFVSFLLKKTSKHQLKSYFRTGKKGSCLRFPWWEQECDGHGKQAVVLQIKVIQLTYSRPAGHKLTVLPEPLRHCRALVCTRWHISGGLCQHRYCSSS